VCSVCRDLVFSAYALSSHDGEPRCGLCRRVEPVFARAVAYGSNEGGLRELIHLLKYAGVRPAANVLGRMLAEAVAELEAELPADPIALVPVPMHRSKLRQREFNHAELIAKAAMKLSPVAGPLQLFMARHALLAPVLVLNASYEPINVCAARRALVLVLKGVAMTEEENGHFPALGPRGHASAFCDSPARVPPHSAPEPRTVAQEHSAARPQHLPVLLHGAALG
jgi:hypothetical protein